MPLKMTINQLRVRELSVCSRNVEYPNGNCYSDEQIDVLLQVRIEKIHNQNYQSQCMMRADLRHTMRFEYGHSIAHN